jgi:flagellum-specific ATP synthase
METQPTDLSSKVRSKADLMRVAGHIDWNIQGRVIDVIGNVIEAALPKTSLGCLVEIEFGPDRSRVLAEVVGIRQDRALLLPYTDVQGIKTGALVSRQRMLDKVPVGPHLLGRVVDPFMDPLIGEKLEDESEKILVPIDRPAPNPMSRRRVDEPLSLGVKAIDGLLTFGNGQRTGIMAGSGVGKSVMMGMMARQTSADVNVIGLIGERGREVRDFIERDLGPEGLARSVVVVVTGDQSPLMKIRAAKVVTSIAEYFSALGKSVLLMMDSLTRVAMAQREIGLSVGELPTTKGYTPSVFSLLPRLLERTGPMPEGFGNISALYTVLVDGDDFNDPIVDASRSILDGQINLSRSLAAKGHYPAIDIGASVSRVMIDVVSKEHAAAANYLRGLLGTYMENFDLVQIGAYQSGANLKLDVAMAMMPQIEKYLQQSVHDGADLASSKKGLMELINVAKTAEIDIESRLRAAV